MQEEKKRPRGGEEEDGNGTVPPSGVLSNPLGEGGVFYLGDESKKKMHPRSQRFVINLTVKNPGGLDKRGQEESCGRNRRVLAKRR